jgi:acylaminoacyl-peptidase
MLSLNNDWICAIIQGFDRKHELVIAKLPERQNESSINWIFTPESSSSGNKKQGVSVDLLTFAPSIPDLRYTQVDFEAILVHPEEKNDTLVVFPHGGPHSCYCSEYSSHVAIFYSLGYSVLLINYRGSSGYGQDSIDSLPGKCGINDVNDCQQAAEFTLKKYGYKRAVIYGGSHGGFLGTHLVGQFPDFYKASSVRNPVTNLASMKGITDIPDWTVCEGLGSYDFDYKKVDTKDIDQKLLEGSPIFHIDKVKTPTLFLIGSVDLRVPPTQGLQFYKALLARNIPTKLVDFKSDCHSLDKPQTAFDSIVLTLLWYEKYLN